MKASTREFYQGLAVGLGTVARNGQPGMAVDAMDTNGVTLSDLIEAGADEFDLKPLREEYALTRRKIDGHKRSYRP